MAVHQTDRYRCLAVLVSSYRNRGYLLELGLPAKNDNAVYLTDPCA